MKVTTVTIECHEKRAHPSEMGRRDASVSYTAQVEEGDDAGRVVEQLQEVAYQQVTNELDKWITEIKTREAQDKTRNDLHWIIERADHSNVERDGELAKFEKDLAILPSDEHAGYRSRLDAARAEFRASVEKALDELIGKAARAELKYHERGNFDGLLGDVPEEERKGYIDKMRDAVAAFELGQAFGGIVPAQVDDHADPNVLDRDDGPHYDPHEVVEPDPLDKLFETSNDELAT